MNTSEALESYTQNKVTQEISKFVTKPVDCHVTFSVDRHKHFAHLSFNGGDGFVFQVEHTCTDMYGSVDHIVDKLVIQMRKQKEKLKSHKGNYSRKDVINFADRAYDSAEIDAGDILKYEAARKRVSNG
jgi:putative sigma-54 modulation protein